MSISTHALVLFGLLTLIYSGVTKRPSLVLPAEIVGLVLIVLGLVLPAIR